MPQTILIVDDEVDLADTWARLLTKAGFSCLVAYDSGEAFSLFDSGQPALVLSDIVLPTADGFEIARYVGRKSPGTPVILMTANHTLDMAENARKAGAALYMRKPVSNSELISSVTSLVSANHK